jgi:hypothetical protein
MIIITTVDHHVKQRRRGRGSVNEQRISNEKQITTVNDILHLQAMKATYCDAVDACTKDSDKAAARLAELFTEFRRTQQGWRISSVRFIQEG